MVIKMKKTSTKKTEKKNESRGAGNKRGVKESNYNFVPFILLAVSLVVETCLIFNEETGVVGGALHNVLTGLFGAFI